MRILGLVVEVWALAVLDPGQDLALGRAIAGQFVCHDGAGYVPQPFQQLREEALRRFGIPAALHQDVEHGAVLVDGAPEVVPFAADAEEHLVEMPFAPGSRPPSAQPIREALGELQAPALDRLVAEDDAALGQEQLDVPEAQRERVVKPNRVGDDRGREAVTMVWIRCPLSSATMAHSDSASPPQPVNVTMQVISMSPSGLGAALRCSPARRRDRGEQGPGRPGRRGIARAARSGSAHRRDLGMTRARKAGDTATAGAAGAYPGRREGQRPIRKTRARFSLCCLSGQSKRAPGRQANVDGEDDGRVGGRYRKTDPGLAEPTCLRAIPWPIQDHRLWWREKGS